MNNLRKVLFTEPCPSETCGVLIQKNGGCNHMKCAKCNYEFCWSCKGSFFKYYHLDAAACKGITCFKNGTAIMLVFMALCSIIYKADLHPQRLLLNILYKVLVFGIGVVYTCLFYGKNLLLRRLLIVVIAALLSLTWSVLNDSFQIFLFFASFSILPLLLKSILILFTLISKRHY